MKPRMMPVCSPSENPHQPVILIRHPVELEMPLIRGVALNVVFMVLMNKWVIMFNFQKKYSVKPEPFKPQNLKSPPLPLPHGHMGQLANLGAVVTLLGALIHSLPAVAADIIPVVVIIVI